MAKRTQKEIEQDCKRIKEAAKTATSMKELEQATGLSYAMINTTLSKHPIIFKRIKEQLDINLANREKAKSEAKKQTSPAIKGIETSHVSTADNFSGFVIDASISGVKNIKELLLKICNTNKKIILTSITIKELENLQKSITLQGKDARYFLALAAENPKSFVSQLIDETIGIPDDCIIKYCADNKDKFILLTSDKAMALKARMYGVEVQYFKKTTKQTNSKVETLDTNANLLPKATPVIVSTNSNIRTLFPAKKIGNKLMLSDFHTDTLQQGFQHVFPGGIQRNSRKDSRGVAVPIRRGSSLEIGQGQAAMGAGRNLRQNIVQFSIKVGLFPEEIPLIPFHS